MSDSKFYVYLNPKAPQHIKDFVAEHFSDGTRVSAVFMQEMTGGSPMKDRPCSTCGGLPRRDGRLVASPRRVRQALSHLRVRKVADGMASDQLRNLSPVPSIFQDADRRQTLANQGCRSRGTPAGR